MPDNLFLQARWIWTADAGDPNFAVRRFRGAFEADAATTLRLHASADSRYTLFLNGHKIGRGPARSDIHHYVYETYEASVGPGRHVLAATVLAYRGVDGPIAEMHERGAFVLEAQAEGGVVLATGGPGWRVQADTAYRPASVTMTDGY